MTVTQSAVAPSAAALDWIERLVRIDTTSRRSNLGLIETVRDHLAAAGLKPHLSHDASGQKANLFATIPAADGGIQGGVVLSLRGGDFKIESGQDLSIGYLDHDADVVRLYLEESFNFRVLEPDAAVALRLGD